MQQISPTTVEELASHAGLPLPAERRAVVAATWSSVFGLRSSVFGLQSTVDLPISSGLRPNAPEVIGSR
jgi:hypothetical protein